MQVSRRALLDFAASVALAGCGSAVADRFGPGMDAGPAGADAGSGDATPDAGSSSSSDSGPVGAWPVGLASFQSQQDRSGAIRKAIELAGGTPWLKQGDTVLIKVAHNSTNSYPFTSSPVAAVAIADMCLAAGAKRVYVADVMGIDATLIPGRWVLESPFGGGFDEAGDATIRAFKASGLYQDLVTAFGSSNIGKNRPIHVTSFREDGWTPIDTEPLTKDGKPRLRSDWVQMQLANGETWTGGRSILPFTPRVFDVVKNGRAGLFVPNLAMNVDHIVDLYRVSTHVMSHFSLSLKNWIGMMRPDDRVWMHQLGYLKNTRGTASDPIRSEPPYNEVLAELHLPTRDRERLYVADASEVIASGGPDEADRGTFPARVAIASTDPVTADVVGLSLIRLAVLASILEKGLAGKCLPPPQTMVSLGLDVLAGQILPWRSGLYGNDGKFCDTSFSPWDWVAVQRARELGLGAMLPADMDLRFAPEAAYTMSPARRAFIEHDARIAPARALS